MAHKSIVDNFFTETYFYLTIAAVLENYAAKYLCFTLVFSRL